MRQIWLRIRDFVLLGALLLVSVVVMINYNDPVMRPMRVVALQASYQVESRLSWVAHYLNALRESDQLRNANMELSARLARLRQAELENGRLRALLALRDTFPFPTLATRIVDKDITRQKNTLTIDVGRADGVRPGMALIDERGILGKVLVVADHHALVQSYLNTDFRVPAQLQAIRTFGIVRWDGVQPNLLRMDHLVKTTPVQKGMEVVTSNSMFFPAGLSVGRIDSVRAQPGQNELAVYLAPSSPIGEAEHAFVLLLTPDPERDSLHVLATEEETQ